MSSRDLGVQRSSLTFLPWRAAPFIVCGGLGSRAKKEPKKAYRDFQAIRRKGVVQGQSRQALMSWRLGFPGMPRGGGRVAVVG